MVKNIVRDISFLSMKSVDATVEDMYIGNDLLDTLHFNKGKCVGMAANMIGYLKRILVFEDNDGSYKLMYNPKIISHTNEYETEEGCLSLDGVRKTKRFKKIKVEYYNEKFQKRLKTFTDFVAQIIQHEIDHMEGIII